MGDLHPDAGQPESGHGGPQPPNQPYPMAAPWPGAMPPPAGPPAPRKPRTGLIVAIGAAAVVLVVGLAGAGVIALKVLSELGGDRPPTRAGGPGTSSSADPARTGRPLFTQLPAPCDLGATLPEQVAGAKPEPRIDSEAVYCQWQVYGADRAADLTVRLDLSTGDDAVDGARRVFARQYEYSGNSAKNGGYLTGRQPQGDLGEEAFAVHMSDRVQYGSSDQPVRTYELGGAEVMARAENVVIDVSWVGASYPPGAAKGEVLRGSRFTYDQAHDQATAIAEHLLAGLR